MDPQQPTAPTNPATAPSQPDVSPAAAAPSPPSTDNLSPVPTSWPGAFGVFKYSKKAVMLNIGGLAAIVLISLAIGIILSAIHQDWTQIITNLFSIYLGIVGVFFVLAGTIGQKQPIGEAFRKGVEPMLFLKMLGLGIIIYASLIASALALVIPFFFVLPRLVLAPYYLIDKKMGIGEALSASWTASNGNSGKVWGIIGLMILMGLLCITVVGIPFAIYLLVMYSASFAVLYRYIDNQPKPAAPVSPVAPVSPTAPTPPTNPTPPAA